MRDSNNIIMTDSHSRDLPQFRANAREWERKEMETTLGRRALIFPWLP
jgi:hypothetical protein